MPITPGPASAPFPSEGDDDRTPISHYYFALPTELKLTERDWDRISRDFYATRAERRGGGWHYELADYLRDALVLKAATR